MKIHLLLQWIFIQNLQNKQFKLSNTQTISVDVHPEPQQQAVQTLPNTTCMPNVIDSVLRPIENIPFTPMISNCVVTFTVNLNSK